MNDELSIQTRTHDLDSFLSSNDGKSIVVVQGLGFVGSAMALVCANAIDGDYAVIGVELDDELNRKKVSDLNNGIFPITATDPKIETFFRSARTKGNFWATTDTRAYEFASTIVVDINLDVAKRTSDDLSLEGYDVDLTPFTDAITTIGKNCQAETLILIETTVPPGTCEKVVRPTITHELIKRGQRADKIKIGHSYERVMPGPNYIDSIQNYYRAYSGIDENSAIATMNFLNSIIRTDQYPLTRLDNTNASEMAKVLENSYRAMNISFMVEWSRLAEEANVNLFQVVDAIRERPTHNNMMLPGLGVGGYCLTKDPLLASWSRKTFFNKGNTLRQSERAVSINDQMPRFAFEFLIKHFAGDLKNSSIMLLGVSYRGDVSDTRYSPVESLYGYLENVGSKLFVHDPLVRFWKEKEIRPEKEFPDSNTTSFDIVIIGCAHSVYAYDDTIDYIYSLKSATIFDMLGFLSKEHITRLRTKHQIHVLGRGDL